MSSISFNLDESGSWSVALSEHMEMTMDYLKRDFPATHDLANMMLDYVLHSHAHIDALLDAVAALTDKVNEHIEVTTKTKE